MKTSTKLLCFSVAALLCVVVRHTVLRRYEEEEQQQERQSAEEAVAARLLVVTRVHMKSASAMPDTEKVAQFVRDSQSYSHGCLICIGGGQALVEPYMASIYEKLSAYAVDTSSVMLLPVSPWGVYTPALNAAVQYAQDKKYDRIAYQVRTRDRG
jgi:hypothetical protein